MLTIALDKLAFIIGKAKECDPGIPGEAGPDRLSLEGLALLGMDDGAATEEELLGVIDSLDPDELADLVALVRMGRDDGEPDEWSEIRFRTKRDLVRSEWRHLMGMPMLGDFLEDGVEALGFTLDEAVMTLH